MLKFWILIFGLIYFTLIENGVLADNSARKRQELNRSLNELQQQLTSSNSKIDLYRHDMQMKLTQLETRFQNNYEQMELQFNARLKKLQTKETSDNQKTNVELAEIEQEILNIEQGPNQTMNKTYQIQNLTSRNTSELTISKVSRLGSMLEWFESANETRKFGRLYSFETNVPTDIQNGGCGGILDGLKGEIRYQSLPTDYPNKRCVWTIRANKKFRVKFQLVNDQLGSSEIRLNGLWDLQLTGETKLIRSGHHTEITLKGYVIFVTLLTDAVGPLSFTLQYEGIGSDSSMLYSHFHFTEPVGNIDFPRIRGDAKYLPREIATFVINPILPSSGLRIQTTKIDTERHADCDKDFLAHFSGKRSHSGYYKLDGPPSTENRYCGQLGFLENAFSAGQGTEAIISVFMSDGLIEYSGFTFNWTSLVI